MNHGSLFSGIGGFDLAAEWMGWDNVFHCEWNEFGQKVLKYYWPKAISYNDITKTDFSIHRGTIDILTGGFPCQPFSLAGNRKGTDDERSLWPEMFRAIREIQPRYVVAENVPGLVNWNKGMVFEQVQSDLETERYEVIPFLLPAAGCQAPHERERVWFIAHRSSELSSVPIQQWRQKSTNNINSNGTVKNGIITNTNSQRLEIGIQSEQSEDKDQAIPYEGSKSSRIYSENSWSQFPTVSPIFVRDDGISNRLDGITLSKWRNESIKGAGNAVVPKMAFQIFKAIEQYELLNKLS